VSVRKFSLALLIVAVVAASTLVTYAIPQIWYKLAEVSGVVRPQIATLVPVTINLGELLPGSSFSAYGVANLTCGSKCDVTRLVVAVPASADAWYSMVRGFRNLYLKVNIDLLDLCLPNIPVVVNGTSAIAPRADSECWKFEVEEGGLAYYSLKESCSRACGTVTKPPNPLLPGPHRIYVSIAGETSTPTQRVELNIKLYLELTSSP